MHRTAALVALRLPLTAAGQWCISAPMPNPPKIVHIERNSYCEASEHNLAFRAKPGYAPVTVEWLVVDDVPAACGNPHSKACAKLENNKCTITTSRELNLAILGHEIRHCFEGPWHK